VRSLIVPLTICRAALVGSDGSLAAVTLMAAVEGGERGGLAALDSAALARPMHDGEERLQEHAGCEHQDGESREHRQNYIDPGAA